MKASVCVCVCVCVFQGNQMTLVFMEREYSSPEEPHLGIVHLVEVGSTAAPPRLSHRLMYVATKYDDTARE